MKIFPAEPAVSGRTRRRRRSFAIHAWTRRRRRRRDRSPSSRTAARSRPCSWRDARRAGAPGLEGKIARRRDGEAKELRTEPIPTPSAPASSSCSSSALINRCAVERLKPVRPEMSVKVVAPAWTASRIATARSRTPTPDLARSCCPAPDTPPFECVLPLRLHNGIKFQHSELDVWRHREGTFDAADAVGEGLGTPCGPSRRRRPDLLYVDLHLVTR